MAGSASTFERIDPFFMISNSVLQNHLKIGLKNSDLAMGGSECCYKEAIEKVRTL